MRTFRLTVFDLLEIVCAMARCDTCESDAGKPVPTGLRMNRRGPADFKIEWWCHGEAFTSRRGDTTANATIEAVFTDVMRRVVATERHRIAEKIAYYGKYAQGDLDRIVALILAPENPATFDPESIDPIQADCPYCSAPAGRHCAANGRGTRPANNWRKAKPHHARRVLAKALALERAMAVDVPPATPPAPGDPPPPEFDPEAVDG